jgi:hypothetical protein
MLVRTGIGFQTVTELLPFTVELAQLMALTVTVLLAGTRAGAEYIPEALIVPVAEPPPVTPSTCQVTPVFDIPETVALKDCVVPARTLALEGETFTVTSDPEPGELEFETEEVVVVPAQPAKIANAGRDKERSREGGRVKLFQESMN